jgi:hypothetical protein
MALLTRAFVADALERVGEETVREAIYADAEKWFRGEKPLPFSGGVGEGDVANQATSVATPTPAPSPEGEG